VEVRLNLRNQSTIARSSILFAAAVRRANSQGGLREGMYYA
jgi:hypothetical protein